MRKRDSFNLNEPNEYGFFCYPLKFNKEWFFASEKYSGIYASEKFDIVFNNRINDCTFYTRW